MQRHNDYRGWHEALTFSHPDEWDEDVRQAFGPGHGAKSFDEWWAVCGRCFVQPDRFLLHVIATEADLSFWDRGVDASQLLVQFNLHEPKVKLVKAFTQLLATIDTGTGRPEHDDIGTHFVLQRRPDKDGYAKAFQVYREFMKGTRPHWQVGLNTDAWGGYSPWDGKGAKKKAPDADDRRIFGVTVSRYVARAEALIRGVKHGVFPARPSDFSK